MKKVQIMLAELTKLAPGKEKEVLVNISMGINACIDWESKTLEELAQANIEFEEDESGEELNDEEIKDLVAMYVGNKIYVSNKIKFMKNKIKLFLLFVAVAIIDVALTVSAIHIYNTFVK